MKKRKFVFLRTETVTVTPGHKFVSVKEEPEGSGNFVITFEKEFIVTDMTISDDKEIAERLEKLADFEPKIKTGYLRYYAEKVCSASTGAVFSG